MLCATSRRRDLVAFLYFLLFGVDSMFNFERSRTFNIFLDSLLTVFIFDLWFLFLNFDL